MASDDARARVKAMELAIVHCPADLPQAPADLGELPCSYAFSGSHAGRNIEAIYAQARAAGVSLSLEEAVAACFGRVRHVLVCGGFFVLHDKAPRRDGVAQGSCETDGPLGVLALLRAFAARGVAVSVFCDVHNGPVLEAGYKSMLAFLAEREPELAERLGRHSRCLPFASDTAPGAEEGSLRSRALRTCSSLAEALKAAWGDEAPGEVDCLFALERLGQPYRNIRGRQIGAHTEPIDCLWPLLDTAAPGVSEASAKAISEFVESEGLGADFVKRLRSVAGVRQDALTLAVGDGGNEVGMGKVAHLAGVVALKPEGTDFVALATNGCYRSCDHLLLSTVSNWAGSAFEMAAQLLFPVEGGHLRGGLADLEEHVLQALVDAHAVDGISAEMKAEVDGMPFRPHHRGLYDLLWALAGRGS